MIPPLAAGASSHNLGNTFLAYYVYSIVSEKPLPVPASDKRSELLQTISDRRIATEHFEAAEDGRVFHEVDELWTETQ